jgi:hypothetical protein
MNHFSEPARRPDRKAGIQVVAVRAAVILLDHQPIQQSFHQRLSTVEILGVGFLESTQTLIGIVQLKRQRLSRMGMVQLGDCRPRQSGL